MALSALIISWLKLGCLSLKLCTFCMQRYANVLDIVVVYGESVMSVGGWEAGWEGGLCHFFFVFFSI